MQLTRFRATAFLVSLAFGCGGGVAATPAPAGTAEATPPEVANVGGTPASTSVPMPTAACELPMVQGPCEASIEAFYFDSATGRCQDFVYGGCEGNANQFETQEACEATCTAAVTVDDEPLPTREMGLMVSPAAPLPCDGASSTAIHGMLVNDVDGSGMPGATVVVTAHGAKQGAAIVTDQDGCYYVGALAAGVYHVAMYYADLSAEIDVTVVAGQVARTRGSMTTTGE